MAENKIHRDEHVRHEGAKLGDRLIRLVLVLAVVCQCGAAAARDFASGMEGGRGLMVMQTARTYGRGAIVAGLMGFSSKRRLEVDMPSGTVTTYEDMPLVIALPLNFGLTDEIDIEAAFYSYHDGRSLHDRYDITSGYSLPQSDIGSTRAGVKIRLPFSPESRIQVAGRFSAVLATSRDQLDGMNYRWTRTGTDIESSVYESFDLTGTVSLHLEQGYVLSGTEGFDDQIVASAGLSWAAGNRLRLNLELNNRTFLGKSPQSIRRAGADEQLYYTEDGSSMVGNSLYLKDTAPDYWEDSVTLSPSLTVALGSGVILTAGARINIADQPEPNEHVQGIIGLSFLSEVQSMVDSDNDGVMNSRDQERGTPPGYPVDRAGISLDTDRDGVPDGGDDELSTPEGARVDRRGCGLDGDSDGVYDGLDLEPDTPPGCPVDRYGVALDSDGDGVPDGLDAEPATVHGAIVNGIGVALDDDGDGVPNGLDAEAHTPRGAIIDLKGVAFDSDDDGIADGLDLEPETPRGLPVDPDGRALVREEFLLLHDGSIRLSAVYFEHGSAVLTGDSGEALDEIGNVLVKYPSLRIQIEGHTDNYGDLAMNMRLARNRAQAVLTYLLEHFPGLGRDRFRVIGYGPEKPIASNSTEEGRRQNRRVEFVVINREELRILNR